MTFTARFRGVSGKLTSGNRYVFRIKLYESHTIHVMQHGEVFYTIKYESLSAFLRNWTDIEEGVVIDG